MTWETLIQRIKDRKCQTAVEPFARNLVDAFGIRFDNLTQEPDLTQGVERAYPFVGEACSLFENPRPVFTITPFAYAYLGTDSFAQVWDIIKQRVTAHPEEQGYLDEVFSAATLLSPTLRPAFLESVRDAAYIGEDMFGLDDILQTVDPSITQSAADLPAEIVDNKNLSHAQRILGAYLQAGLFHPQTGFVKEFPALFKSMQGFRYLLHNPNDAMALVVADDKTWKRIQLEVQHNPPLLHVDAYNTRYGLNEEHPGIVLVTQSVEPAKVQALYPESTLVYTGIDRNAQNILEALPNRMMFIPYGPSTLASALQFISVQRQGGQRNLEQW